MTFATQFQPIGTIEPKNTQEVQAAMRKAYANKQRIYPISGGKNWGNGSKAPCAPNCILMDLGHLNQISDFSEKLAYVTVGPGVTQIQLIEFLKDHKSGLMPSLTGSSRQASLIGNALERGDGFGAYGEHTKYICNLEIVLPNGDLFYTGFDHNSKCASLSTASLGPSLDGLFLQSNLGIVTRATLWLEPKPEYFHQAIFEANSLSELGSKIEIIRTLQMRHLTPYVCLWNDVKFRSRLRNPSFECSKWAGVISLFAFDQEQADYQIRQTRCALGDLTILKGNFDLRDHENLAIAYSQKPGPMPENPDLDRDQCGLMWCMALLPYRGQDLEVAIPIIESLCTSHGFETNLALIATEPRTLKLLLALVYDRDRPGWDQKAQACHNEILKELETKGYPPYRLGLQSMWTAKENELYMKLKNAVDPYGILSPGHYSPDPSRFSSRSSSSL